MPDLAFLNRKRQTSEITRLSAYSHIFPSHMEATDRFSRDLDMTTMPSEDTPTPSGLVFDRKQSQNRDKWVPVTTAWRVLRLQMKERPLIWGVAANILNKQSRTADEGWSSSLGVGRGANNASP